MNELRWTFQPRFFATLIVYYRLTLNNEKVPSGTGHRHYFDFGYDR